MKVKEMIKLLRREDPDAEVLICDAEWGYGRAGKPKAIVGAVVEYHFTNDKAEIIPKGVVV